MKERVLITGSSGFVGYHLIEAALRRGLEVFAAARPSSNIEHLRHKPVRFTFTDFSDLDKACADINHYKYAYIIHAAGTVRAANEQVYNQVNAEFTRTLALAAKSSATVKKFVFISSLAAVGPTGVGEKITERNELRPLTEYGRSKALAERYVGSIPLLPLLVLRPTAVYGPRERDIFMMLKSVSRGIEPYIGKKEQELSFIYVKDLAELAVVALASPLEGRTFNVSDGHTYGRADLAKETKLILRKKTMTIHLPLALINTVAAAHEFIGSLSGKSPVVNRQKIKELTAASWSCNIDALRNELGYHPRYNLRTGLAETLEWYNEHGWL